MKTFAPRSFPGNRWQGVQAGLAEEEQRQLRDLSVSALRKAAKVPFHLVKNRASLLKHLADHILDEVRSARSSGRRCRMILPVGPVEHYRRVVEQTNRERLSWRHVDVFNMDEFLDWQARPLAQSHPYSMEGFMRREVFGRMRPELRPEASRIVFPHPERLDEARLRIAALGGIDCCFGGIGYHGHVAFNEPPLSRWRRISEIELRGSLTRIVALGDDSIVVQSIHGGGGDSSAIPPMAVTLGMGEILAARSIRLYCAAGERHRTVFRQTVAGNVTVDYPSTLIQGHPDAKVITDQATAQPIKIGFQ